jgi:MFS family permease
MAFVAIGRLWRGPQLWSVLGTIRGRAVVSGLLGLLSFAFLGADTAANLVWGYLGDKTGFRLVLLISLLGWIGATLLLLWSLRADVLAMAKEPLEAAIHHASHLVLWSALALSASTLLIAAVDVPFQLFDHAGKLRMTTQQVRDEMKESEGRPEVKSRIRQLQRQMAKHVQQRASPLPG